VDRHGDVLYRYALLRLRSPDVAADVVQETFLEALRARGSFAGRSTERTWLVGILKHKVVDHFRRSGRRQVLENGHYDPDAPARPDFDHRGHFGSRQSRGAVDRADHETREF